MPYIQKELRFPIIDDINKDVASEWIDAATYVEILENELEGESVPREKWDAVINYALTKLLQTKDFDSSDVVHRIYIQFFEEHGYYGRERFIGLLTLIKAELMRRKWSPRARRFLAEQIEIYVAAIGEYEKRKLEENGDII
jgi:hypothetical protein